MKTEPWVYRRSRPTKLDIELQRIQEFKVVYNLEGLEIRTVEGHPKHPELFWQVSHGTWCFHVYKQPGATHVNFTEDGLGLWSGPVAISDLAGVVLGSLRTAARLGAPIDL